MALNNKKNYEKLSIQVGDKIIHYNIRRSAKAVRIQLKITKSKELELVLPQRAPLSLGLQFMERCKPWINDRIKILFPEKKAPRYFFLGNELTLEKNIVKRTDKLSCFIKEGRFVVNVPEGIKTDTHTIFDVFLKTKSKQFLISTCQDYADKNQFSPKRIIVRDQKTRWGSCSSKKTISLNFNLIKLRQELIDYVIFHELCHLRFMNHSPSFWREVARYSPNYKALRYELKRLDIAGM